MDVNNSTHAYEHLRWIQPIPVHTTITLYSILLVLSLLGNVLVIAVVYCNQTLRTNMNYLIVNMAVSDLLVPLVAMPWMISIHKLKADEWLVDGYLGDALCKLVPFLSRIAPFVSSISLTIVAFQRFFAVVYPIRKPILTRKRRWIVIFFPWIVAMALFSPYLYTFRLTNGYLGYTICDFLWSPAFDPFTANIIFFSFLTIIGFIIPFITIILLYSIMFYKLHKSLKNVVSLIERGTILSRQRRNRRIFCMSVNIIVTFIICWCPIGVLEWIRSQNRALLDDVVLYKLTFAFILLWKSLSVINPCIYFVFLRDFRQGLKKLFSLG